MDKKNNLSGIKVPLMVSLGETSITLEELAAFTSGTVVRLNRESGKPVDVIVSGEKVAQADVVVIDNDFGIRITQVLDREV